MPLTNINNSSNEHRVERLEATVKWYSPIKGYGFLISKSNAADIMIHMSHLSVVKCPYLKPGDHVICDVISGKLGLQVFGVIEVKYGSEELRSLKNFYESRLMAYDPANLEEKEGVIKWFNPEKGYGFVLPNDGTKEIFLPHAVVRAAGYKVLNPSLRVSVKIAHSPKGPEACRLRILSDNEKE